MRIKTYEVPQEVVSACEKRILEKPFKAFNIEAIAMLLGVPQQIGTVYIANRVADRLIQKHRKAGNIHLGYGRMWYPTKSPNP